MVWLSGGGSATLHYRGLDAAQLGGESAAERLSADLLLLIADRVAVLGLKRQAALVVADVMRESSAIFDPEIASKALFILLEGGPVGNAIDLLHALVHQGPDEVAIPAMLMTLSWARAATKEARRQIIDAFIRWPTDPGDSDRDLHAGQFVYNAAQLSRQDDRNEALSLLLRAAELDPAYLDRGYWWRERGGLLFLLGRHQEAAAACREAVARGEATARPLLADALLWSREIGEAVDLFIEVANDASLSKPEWRLKANVFGELHKYQDPESRLTDLLDAELLHRLALENPTPESARIALVIGAALAAETTPELWLQAMGVCLEDGDLFEDVAVTARRFCGDDIIDCILEKDSGTDAAHHLIELFEQLPSEPEAPNVLRFVAPGAGGVHVIDLNELRDEDDGTERPSHGQMTRGSGQA